MRVDINLASHPYEDLRRFWLRWGSLLGVLSIVLLVVLFLVVRGWQQARATQALIDQGKQRVASLESEKASAEATLGRQENRSTRDRSQFLNSLFERKAFSWTQVFEDLERIMPPRVHVVSIHPDMASDNQLQIKLVVAGDSPGRVLELVRKMEGSQQFKQTEIHVQSSVAGQQTAEDKVSFDISALYIPQSPATAVSPGGSR